MDEQLQAKIQEARDAGYTDEEISQYLQTKNQPLPVEQPISRADEAFGTMQSALPQAAIYAGEGAALGYGAKALKDAFGNRPGPVAPAVPTQATVPAQQTVNARPNLSVQQGGTSTASMPKTIPGPVAPTPAQSIVQKIALNKVMQAAGPALAIGQGLMYTSPEEEAILKEAEQKRLAAGGQPKKRIDWLANLGK